MQDQETDNFESKDNMIQDLIHISMIDKNVFTLWKHHIHKHTCIALFPEIPLEIWCYLLKNKPKKQPIAYNLE